MLQLHDGMELLFFPSNSLTMKTTLASLLVVVTSASLCFAASQSALPEKPALGLQLYSLREEFKQDVPKTLKLIASMGIKQVETAGTYGNTPGKFRQMLRDAGLDPVSGHFPFDQLEKNPAAVAAEAKALGLPYAGCAWIPHSGDFSVKDAQHAAKVFNRAGEEMAKLGIRFFYHCHGYEFQKSGDGVVMDVLMKECAPEKVAFEMDVAWLYLPGQDPFAWLQKYAGRWELIHIKDLKPGVARGSHSGGTDKENESIIGQGQLDWSALLKTARKTGVKVFIIEDETKAAAKTIPQSVAYLQKADW